MSSTEVESLKEIMRIRFNAVDEKIDNLKKSNQADHMVVKSDVKDVKRDVGRLKTTVDRWSGALAIIMALAVLLPLLLFFLR